MHKIHGFAQVAAAEVVRPHAQAESGAPQVYGIGAEMQRRAQLFPAAGRC